MHDHTRHAALFLLLSLSAISSCASTPSVIARHDDGSVASTGHHAAGLRDGPWTDFYPNGRKQSEGSYEKDVQSGVWTYWFANGNKEMEGSFVDERRDGEWTSWYENGALRAQGRFERGFEEGPWRFYDGAGALEHEGSFELGKPVLRWTYFRADGTVRATGNYLGGVRVGEWTELDAAGEKTILTYPLSADFELVEERFADSTLKRAGFLRDGVPTGRWITRHPGGELRLECTFESGEPNGRARAWRPGGTWLATGSLERGSIVGEWVFARGAAHETSDFKVARPRATFSGEWSPASSAELGGVTVVETWVSEMCSPRQPAPIRSVPSTATRTVPASEPRDVAGIPARAQPWTEYESTALPALVNLYGTGKSSGAGDAEDWSAPVVRKRKVEPESAGASSLGVLGLIGHALPVKHFTTADGGTIDLDELAGQKNVAITILRGFGGQVCVYCAAQTKGLSDFADKFAALDTEVLVVFPGPASGLDAFLDAYRRTFGPGEKLPYKLLYDTDLVLTRALHIEDNIAVPTSLVLDKKGIIRWCHVAKDYADRPSAQQVLDQIAALPGSKR